MRYLAWPLRLAAFVAWFLGQIVVTNTRVIADIVTPGHRSRSVVARHATGCRGEFEAALLAVLVSLTPGTLVLATAREQDRFVFYVHSMYLDGPPLDADLDGLERRLLHALRPGGVR